MELARIELNLASAEARRDLGDPYQMHRTLSRVFAEGPEARPTSFLWRLEPVDVESNPVLLVQSTSSGRWQELARGSEPWLSRHSVREWIPEKAIADGARILFRVRCNPTVTRDRKRLGLWREDEQRGWFLRQAEKAGMESPLIERIHSERMTVRQGRSGRTITVCAACFEGHAIVRSPEALAATIERGIGHARMLGLGLLSVAPDRS